MNIVTKCKNCEKWIKYSEPHAMGQDAFCTCGKGLSGLRPEPYINHPTRE